MWALIQHTPYDGAGGVAAALVRAGEHAITVRPYAGQAAPAVADLRGLVVFGGPGGSADDDVPHLSAERTLLAEAAERGLPILGVCFGAQLLSVALGGSVDRAANPQVGMGRVHLTDEGLADPVLGPAGSHVPVMHWHRDICVPPSDAVVLATSDSAEVQAFRCGERAYALQFHVEITAELASIVRQQIPGITLDDLAVSRASTRAGPLIDRFVALQRG